jgi:DNA polymerase-3 subunit gamma/tau
MMEQFSIQLRPYTFDDILGQERIKKDLIKRAETRTWPKAMLMQGMYGTGKTTVAQIIAMSLQCQHTDKRGNPCGVCASCKSIIEERFDRDTMRLDGSQIGQKDSVIEFTSVIKVRPMYDPKRVFIIEESDQLSSAAINALLKILEHPQDDVHFILLSMKQGGAPPAIQSRCQVFNFKPFSVKETMLALKAIMERKGYWNDESIPATFKTEGLSFIASASKGSLRSALQYLEAALVGEYYTIAALQDAFSTVDEVATYNILRGVLSLSKDEGLWESIYKADPAELYNYMTAVLADVMIFKQTGYIKNEMFLHSTKQLAANPYVDSLFELITNYPALQKPYVRRADIIASLAMFYIKHSNKPPTRPVRRVT